MSIKSLFDRIKIEKSLVNKTAEDIGAEVESVNYHEADVLDESRFIPAVDFSKAENFARYGSAKKYYEDAIQNIFKTYPYDGSLYEKINWENSSSYIDLHILDKEYPRTNGYVNFSHGGWGAAGGSTRNGYGLPSTLEYISLYGGPNTKSTSPQVQGANIWDPTNNRESNLEFDLTEGVSVEFWLKKDAFITASTEKEVIFDLWNYVNGGTPTYGRFRIELTGAGPAQSGADPFRVTLLSGAVGIQSASVCASTFTTASVADGNWHHYAFTFKSASAGVTSRFYVDGDLNQQTTLGTAGINKVTGSMMAYIGALRTRISGGSAAEGAGKLSGSLDEFRYWKEQRSSKDIGRYWFTQVGGGANSDLSNTSLGVYYKFNEGITGTKATDATILDYSGRVSNGTWTGYAAGARSTGSAIVISEAATKEFRDPIVYSSHPDVISLYTSLGATGSVHDYANNTSLFAMFPSWMQEKDSEEGDGLLNLTQIMASYFDSLYLQVESLNKIKAHEYVSGSDKPNVFANRLLEGRGLLAPELFLDADVLEKLADRSENMLFSSSLNDIKNTIYQNIYNNLIQIYKSKGTEKSFRNLIRCFGIDEEIIKLSLYGNNVEYDLRKNTTVTDVRKRLIDFNHTDRFDSVVFQNSSSTNSNSVSFITGSTDFLDEGYAFTLETEILFPKPFAEASANFATQNFTALTASLFGVHTAISADPAATTWNPLDATNFQVYAVRDETRSSNAKFVLSASTGGCITGSVLSSSLYNQVYNNSKWSLAVRIKPDTYAQANFTSGSNSDSHKWIVDFYGVEYAAGVLLNEFHTSGTLNRSDVPKGFVTGSKRIYVGAHVQDFTGSVIKSSDVKVAACRYWVDYLDNEAIRAHAKDVSNYGALRPSRNAYLYQSGINNFEVPQAATLAMNWDFETITGSSASGEFVVPDFSSGSTTLMTSRYGFLGNIINAQHTGRGYGFPASNAKVVDVDYIISDKQNLPENLYSEDMIKILTTQDDLEFTRESRPISFFFAFEKSMYRNISEEMLNMFGTITDFNNLIGEPVNKYRPQYKALSKLRQLFFERVGNTPDLDKFVEFYKWFDSALTKILQQLVPAGADFAENIRVLVENHILARDKYQHKFPTLEMKMDDPIGTVQTVLPLGDDQPHGLKNGQPHGWKFAHHPVTNIQNENATWWKYYADRNKAPLRLPTAGANTARSMVSSSVGSARRRRSGLPYRFTVEKVADQRTIRSGINYSRKTRRDIVYQACSPVGPLVTDTNLPANVMLAFGNEVERFQDTDPEGPVTKKRLGFGIDTAINRNLLYRNMDGNISAPFNLYKSSVKTGYNAQIVNRFAQQTFLNENSMEFGRTASDYVSYVTSSVNIGTAATWEALIGGTGATAKAFSISAWVQNVSMPGGGFGGGGEGRVWDFSNGDRSLYFTTTNKLKFEIRDDSGGGAVDVTSDTNSMDGNWHQVICTFEGGTIGALKIYIDGVLQGSDNVNVPESITSDDCFIGNSSANTKTWGGFIDEVIIWNKSLSSSEIAEAYNGGRIVNARTITTYSNMIAWYRMGDSAGDSAAPGGTIYDAINGYNGTVAGDPRITSHAMRGTLQDVELTNLHADVYGPDYETPMQGPFTEKFVGGRQHRHIEVNKGPPWQAALDTPADRAEGFKLLVGTFLDYPGSPASGAIGIVGPQYPLTDSPAVRPPYLFNRPKATRMRDEGAKRPVNIKNILMTTGSLSQSVAGALMHSRIGNYQKNYQVVQTAGRSLNDPFFKDQSFDFALNPETTATRGRLPLDLPLRRTLEFDGNNDYIGIGTGATWDGDIGGAGANAAAFSISMWVYPTTQVDVFPYFISFGNNWRVLQTWGNAWPDQIRFSIRGTAGSVYAYSATNAIVGDTWQHVIVTYSGAASGDMKIYIDGVLSGTPGTGPADILGITSGEACTIGSYYNGSQYNWPGNMCDVAVWGRELSQSEVDILYGSGTRINPKTSLSAGPISWWPMGADSRDAYDGIIHDEMRFQNGTPNNFPATALANIQSPPFGGYGSVTENIGGNLDYTLPDRSGTNSNETVIVNRFNAPGGYDVSSRGYMDPAHEEKSVYNALPFRNRNVIDYGHSGSVQGDPSISGTVHVIDQLSKSAPPPATPRAGRARGLNQRWALYSGQFGFDPAFGSASAATYVTVPSWNKVNRNTRRRIEESDVPLLAGPGPWSWTANKLHTTGSVYDNAWVSHPIPRSDKQYLWITSSLSGNAAYPIGISNGYSTITEQSFIHGYDEASTYAFFPNDGSVYLTGSDYYNIGTAATWESLIGGTGANAKAFTISMWVNSADVSDTQYLCNFGAYDRSLYFESDGSAKITFFIYGNTENGAVRTSALSDSTWYHVVATFDGGDPAGATGGGMKLYIDGVDDTNAVASNDLDNPQAIATTACSIGAANAGAIGYFNGFINQVSIWNAALTSTEVSELYAGRRAMNLPYHSRGSSLISWWMFNNADNGGDVAPAATVPANYFPNICDVIGGRTAEAGNTPVFSTTLGPAGWRYNSAPRHLLSQMVISASSRSPASLGSTTFDCGDADFAGLRTLVVDDVDSSTNTLGSTTLGGISYAGQFNGREKHGCGFIDIGTAATWNTLIGDSGTDAKAFTVSMWIKPTEVGVRTAYLASFGTAATGARVLYLGSNQRIYGYISGDTNGYILTPATELIEANKWYHVVWTFEGGDPEGESGSGMKLYVNAVDVGEAWGTDLDDPDAISGNRCVLGNYWLADGTTPGETPFEGNMADVAIWDADMTAALVVDLYNASPLGDDWSWPGAGRFKNIKDAFTRFPSSFVDSLLAWWRLNPIINGAAIGRDSSGGTAYPAAPVNINYIHDSRPNPEGFNVLMLNRNGPYGWPTFRQTEMGHSSPVTRYQRKNSQLTLRTKTVYDASIQTAPPTAPVTVKGNAIASYTEPVVESGHRTMVHTLVTNSDMLDTKTNQMTTQRQALVYNHSFGNKVAYFANTSLNNKLNLKYNTDQSNIYFNRINSLLLKSEVNSMEDTPFASIDKIAANYRQQIYPASYNTYLNRTRRRTTFNIRDIWNDDPLKRRNEWGENLPVYPFGVSSSIGPIRQVEEGIDGTAIYGHSASVWPLDCHFTDGAAAELYNDFSTLLSVDAKDGAGVLQNGFCGYGQFGSASISASVVYAQRGMFGADTKGRTVSPNAISQPITNFGGDQPWQVGEQAGNNVPYLAYDRYCEQMRLAGKDFSIIPEFRMSEHIEFYVDQNGGNFWVDNNGEFDLTGSSIADSSVDNFYKVYSNSDFMKLFTVVDDAYDDEELVNGDIMKKDKITLQCNALIKFLPYKGFYPAERVMELSRLLSASYGPYMRAETCTRSGRYTATFVGASPSDFKQTRPAFRSFTEPLIGPGILCNTIKSGIAVENYLIRNSYDLWYRANSYMFGFEETNGGRLQLHGAPYISQNPTVQSVPMPERTQGRRHRGYYGRGLMDIQHSGAASQTSYFYMSKLPFEALLDPEAYMSRPALIPAMQGGGAGFEGGHIYDRGLYSGSISASYAGKSIISGEGITTRSTLSNVLWDGGGRDLYKLAIDNFVCETVNFFQDDLKSYISVREDQFKPVVSGSTYAMKVRLYRPIHSFGITSGDDGAQTADSTLNLMNRPDTGSFQMFNRHSAFGRPISSSADIDQNCGVIPSWVHVTPPYYDGVAEATIVYTADMSAKPTLADIISNSKVYYSRTGEYVTTGSATNTINLNSYSRDERQKAMQLSASVNLFEQMTSIIPGTTRPTKRWLIQSKFETPVLNFANVSGAIPAMANSPTASQQGAPVKMTVDNEPTIGMWLQKGSLPKEEAGIFLSLNPPLGGIKVGSAGTFYRAPKSLIDIVGFVPGKGAKIGTIKTEKVVEEAVVAIPFTLGRDGRRKFYKIRKKDVDNQIRRNRGETIDEGVPTDVQIIVNAVGKYIFPPKFDFIRNGNIDPFAMFIFEFKKVLTQENLANIWQNIPPNISYQQQSGEVEDGTFERQTAAMQHSLLSDVIFDNNNRKITKDLRWMVFKVKIRGASDYNRFRRRNLPQDVETIPPSIDSPYSYNWPYDYFSLVELVNIEAGMQYGSTPRTPMAAGPAGTVPTTQMGADCLDQVQINQIIDMGGSVPAGRGCPGTTHAPGGAGAIPEPEE